MLEVLPPIYDKSGLKDFRFIAALNYRDGDAFRQFFALLMKQTEMLHG